jgi:hypothetical protein
MKTLVNKTFEDVSSCNSLRVVEMVLHCVVDWEYAHYVFIVAEILSLTFSSSLLLAQELIDSGRCWRV